MSKPKVIGIDLYKNLIFIHYIDDDNKIIDEKIATIRWKTNPALKRLVQAFAEVASHNISNKKPFNTIAERLSKTKNAPGRSPLISSFFRVNSQYVFAMNQTKFLFYPPTLDFSFSFCSSLFIFVLLNI